MTFISFNSNGNITASFNNFGCVDVDYDFSEYSEYDDVIVEGFADFDDDGYEDLIIGVETFDDDIVYFADTDGDGWANYMGYDVDDDGYCEIITNVEHLPFEM